MVTALITSRRCTYWRGERGGSGRERERGGGGRKGEMGRREGEKGARREGEGGEGKEREEGRDTIILSFPL